MLKVRWPLLDLGTKSRQVSESVREVQRRPSRSILPPILPSSEAPALGAEVLTWCLRCRECVRHQLPSRSELAEGVGGLDEGRAE